MTPNPEGFAAIMQVRGTFSELIDMLITMGAPADLVTEAGLLALITIKANDAVHPYHVASWLRDAADTIEASIIDRAKHVH